MASGMRPPKAKGKHNNDSCPHPSGKKKPTQIPLPTLKISKKCPPNTLPSPIPIQKLKLSISLECPPILSHLKAHPHVNPLSTLLFSKPRTVRATLQTTATRGEKKIECESSCETPRDFTDNFSRIIR